jgi:hypothetical protein
MGGGAAFPLVEAPLRAQIRPGGASARRDRAFLICLACNAPLFIRDSERETDTVKKLTLACSNTGCAETSVWDVSLRYLLVPGHHHNEERGLPICPHHQVPQIYPPSNSADDDDGQSSMFEIDSG